MFGMETGYFATELDDGDVCALGQAVRNAEFDVFHRYAFLAGDDVDEIDYDLEVERLSWGTGWKPARIRSGIESYYLLRHMPQLYALQERTQRLDLVRIEAIAETILLLDGADRQDVFAIFDEILTDLFTPKKEGAVLPTATSIRRLLNGRLRRIDASLVPDPKARMKREQDKAEVEQRVDVRFADLSSRESQMIVETNPLLMSLIEEAVKQTAKELDLPLGEVVRRMLVGEVQAASKITLNVFASKDDPSTYFVPKFGWTDARATAEINDLFEQHPPKVVDLDAAADIVTPAYVPAPQIRAFVHARDGGCIFPGCEIQAQRCQLDHRIPFDDGGETTASNLFCLCTKHHNMKTDHRAFYVPDPDTGDIVWIFQDGTYQLSQPDGPMWQYTNTRMPRWRRSIKNQVARRAARAAFFAQCHSTMDAYEKDGDFLTCIQKLHALEERYQLSFEHWPDMPLSMLMDAEVYARMLFEGFYNNTVTAEELIVELGFDAVERELGPELLVVEGILPPF